MIIPYATQSIGEDDITAVVETLKSGMLTTGPKIAEFERELCNATGAKYAVAVANGAAALHLSALTMGIGPGDEVIVPPLTFAASANCVLYCGGTPVFADIDTDTMLLNTEDVRNKITERTKAVLPVHFGGELCDMDALADLTEKHNIALLQDSAHSIGGKIRGKGQGEYPGQQIWSFHAVKTITTGEGGAVTTNNEGIYKTLLHLRTHGITRDPAQYVHEDAGGWYYEMLDLGFNYRLTDMQCALGLSQLKKLPYFAKRRAEITAYYNDSFAGLPIQIQKSPEWSNPVRHLYTIRVNEKNKRREIFDKLRAKNIGVNVHYIPVYWFPYYESLGFKRGLCPVAEDSYERMITLPLYSSMTDEMAEYVVSSVKEVI